MRARQITTLPGLKSGAAVLLRPTGPAACFPQAANMARFLSLALNTDQRDPKSNLTFNSSGLQPGFCCFVSPWVRGKCYALLWASVSPHADAPVRQAPEEVWIV